MKPRMVDSWPPCWVAEEVKTEPTLPTSPLGPKAAGLVREIAHLRGDRAEAGAGADDDRVIVRQFVDGGDRSRLVDLVIGSLGDVFRNQFRHALDGDLGTGRLRAFGDGIGHGFDMAVSRIIKDENLRHLLSSLKHRVEFRARRDFYQRVWRTQPCPQELSVHHPETKIRLRFSFRQK